MNAPAPEPDAPSRRDAAGWIRALDLAPHPEGGYFREVYRSPVRLPGGALPPRYGGGRCLATHIFERFPRHRAGILALTRDAGPARPHPETVSP